MTGRTVSHYRILDKVVGHTKAVCKPGDACPGCNVAWKSRNLSSEQRDEA